MLLLLVILFLLSLQYISYSPEGKGIFREKREQNSYGDENVIPEEGGPVAGYEEQVEQTAAPVDNGYETDQPDVYPAGYRWKREGMENGQGDEGITPKGTEEALQAGENPEEETSETIRY